MYRKSLAVVLALAFVAAMFTPAFAAKDGWISLFDGKSLDGWKASENKSSCRFEDGKIVLAGPRSHLFYVGDVKDANFTNFEFKCKVLTKPNANAGIYFHTEYQETGWPNKGYEAQINNTHKDRRKTGSLYAVKDVMDNAPAKDNEWFDYHIKVQGKTITLKINGETTVEYTEPADGSLPNKGMKGRKLSSGTFAFQAHDPGSVVYIKDVKVKPLP